MEKFLDDRQQINLVFEYIINQGLKGNHLLFDNEQIRRAFEKGAQELTDLGTKKIQDVRDALREIFSKPDMDAKREYIAGLPEEIQNVLIFLYFQILEKNLLLKKSKPH